MKLITREVARELYHGKTLYHVLHKNADGSPQRWRVSGKVKTWKSKNRQHEFKVPIKHGLYDNDYLTHENYTYLRLTEEEALNFIS